MSDPTYEYGSIELREKIAHIDQMLADIDRTFADRDRKRQEIKLAPWVLVVSAVTGGMTAGAALFAAGAAFVKVFG